MNGNHNWAAALQRFLARLWWKPMLVLTAGCLLVQEQYPFSHFPMYSSFGRTTYYLYLADGTGAPIATLPTIGLTTPTLKKVFSTGLRKERERLGVRSKQLSPEQKRQVGERFLAGLKESPAVRQRGMPLPPALRLYEVNISLVKGRFEKEAVMIAEVR